jgi:hypothetical protein
MAAPLQAPTYPSKPQQFGKATYLSGSNALCLLEYLFPLHIVTSLDLFV